MIQLCPVDSEEIVNVFPDRCAMQEVNKLKVFCFFKNQGCPWVGMMLNFLQHIDNECQYGKKLQACEFSFIGCDWKGDPEEMKKHVMRGSSTHLQCIGGELAKKYNTLEVASSICESISLTLSECTKRIEEDSDGILAVKSSSGFKSRTDAAKSRIDSVTKQQDQTGVQCLELSKNVVSAKVWMPSFQELLKRFQSISSRAEKVIESASNVAVWTSVADDSANSRVQGYEQEFKRLEKERRMCRENLMEVDLRIRLFQATSKDGKYMWKIDKYPRRMKEATEGKIIELYSPPLYSDEFGYKVCCKIYLNGKPNEPGHGTHISFYMILMKGDYDGILKFPFPRMFCVALLCQQPGLNVEKKIEPSNSEEFQRPEEDMNNIVGYSKFISHADLSHGRYIWGDSLFFKIDFTKVSPNFSGKF